MNSLSPLRKLMEDALEQMLLEISPVLSNGAHHKAADYWGWNWVRRSERLKRESYLEMVQDALKKVTQ